MYTYKFFCIYYDNCFVGFGTEKICKILNSLLKLSNNYSDLVGKLVKQKDDLLRENTELKKYTAVIYNKDEIEIIERKDA